ncbi:hypothetical protein BCR22_07560 [Enterococcus plantarum]|uniref:DUF2142 domain-containing protein n=1 Tax=Enterococcus plantarum TaxID=1077675 RepID=UPI00084DFC9F|nr:DUF2142 domain-containing protein [Enterococcus plantarum]OEG09443.1 hypothetical protein BCR22_07560 [Enterococcus plantarum]
MADISMDKKKKNLYKWLIILLSSVFVVLLIEMFVFNFSYFRYGNVSEDVTNVTLENIKKTGENSYKLIDKTVQGKIIIPNTESKATRLSFITSVAEGPEAKIKITSPETNYGERKIQHSLEVIKLTDQTKPLTLSFIDVGDREFQVSEMKKTNQFHFNVIRFFVLVSFVIFVVLIAKGTFKNRYEYFAFLTIILFGSLLSILMPVGQTMDERAHILKSISVAEGNLFFENGDKLELPAGFESMYKEEPYTAYEEFRDMYNKNTTKETSVTIEEKKETSAVTYPFLSYIFSGIGIKVAMLFQLPMIFYVWFARIFNVVAYGLLAFFSIKKMPYGKRVMAFFAVQPVMLYLAASVGVDALLVGVVMLGFAQIMRIRYEKSHIKLSEFILIASCFSMAIIIKVVYAPVLVLFFLLRRENFKNKKAQWILYSTLSIILFIVALLVYKYSADMGINQWRLPNVDSDKQTVGIIKNPISYLKMLTLFFSSNSISYLSATFGLMGYVLVINPFVTLLNICVWVFLCLFDYQEIQKEKNVYFTITEKMIVGFSILSMIILSATALYMTFTPVGADKVDGYQARYLTPMAFLATYMLTSRKLESKYSEQSMDKIAFFSSLLLLIFVFIQILIKYYS